MDVLKNPSLGTSPPLSTNLLPLKEPSWNISFQVWPPFVVTWINPSSVPDQINPSLTGDSDNDVILLLVRIKKKYNLQHCLNIGCHIGTLALPLSKSFKKITAIEAYPPTFEHLKENIKLNNIKNIETYNLH